MMNDSEKIDFNSLATSVILILELILEIGDFFAIINDHRTI